MVNRMERWKDIPGYEGLYQASTEGQIRSAPGKVTNTQYHGNRHWQTRILKGRGDNPITGKRVGLWKDGKLTEWLVARLVALTWVPGFAEGMTVNHINGNRLDNQIENLEWLTIGDNIRDGFRTGLFDKVRTPVTLKSKNSGEVIKFESMISASVFLGKNIGFVSLRFKRNNLDFGDYVAVEMPNNHPSISAE